MYFLDYLKYLIEIFLFILVMFTMPIIAIFVVSIASHIL